MKTNKPKGMAVRDTNTGWILFTGYIGALVFFIERNQGFWGDMLAFFQALVWPAYLLYAALKLLQV